MLRIQLRQSEARTFCCAAALMPKSESSAGVISRTPCNGSGLPALLDDAETWVANLHRVCTLCLRIVT